MDMDMSTEFKVKAQKYKKQLDQFNQITKFLQKEHLSLSDCRLALDTLTESLNTDKTKIDHPLFECMLQNSSISQTSNLVTDRFFEKGVVKLQRGFANQLTSSEKTACKSLLYVESEITASQKDIESDIEKPVEIMERIHRKRRKIETKGRKYIDTRFILGSVAIVKRLWSKANISIRNHRKSASPLLIEAILFLKINQKYWDLSDVCKSMARNRSDRVKQRMTEEQQMEDLNIL